MRIREMKWMGVPAWPPQWSDSSHPIDETAVLKGVKLIIATDLCRIDVDYNGIPHLGVMFSDKELRESLYHKLKENLGRQLTEIADLEIELDQGKSQSPARPA
jgi:hypothetical protein